MAALLNQQVGGGPKKIINSRTLYDLGVLLYVIKATEIISCTFVAI